LTRWQHVLHLAASMLTASEICHMQVGPSLAINYCAYETSRSVWLSYSDLQSPTVVMSLLCGSFAGLVSSTATFPLDLARRRMQVSACSRLSVDPSPSFASSCHGVRRTVGCPRWSWLHTSET
jgi:Mitochondrial carrier protein